MTNTDQDVEIDQPTSAGSPEYEDSNFIPIYKSAARRRLSEHQWLQIEQAAAGRVEGFAYEWPDLRSTLQLLGIVTAWDCPARVLRTICLVIVTRESLVRCEADRPTSSGPGPEPSKSQP